MNLVIRPLRDIAEYKQIEALQRAVWHFTETQLTPDNVLVTAAKNGGVVLAAFDHQHDPEQAVGFVFGFIGRRSDGRYKHCSHLLGVLPAYQSQQVGYQLKLAQRDAVLQQGIDLITWTFDPLQSKNAYLNLHKLGAVVQRYIPNAYGAMNDDINRGMPSDRLEVDWHLASAHVQAHLSPPDAAPSVANLLAAGVPIINPAADDNCPSAAVHPLAGPRLLVQAPRDINALKRANHAAALAWQEQVRAMLTRAFASGYTAVNMLSAEQRSYYLLAQNWSPT